MTAAPGVNSTTIPGLGANEGTAQALLIDLSGGVDSVVQAFNASAGSHPIFLTGEGKQRTWRQREFSMFVQDDFRLKPGLSGFARIRRSAKDVLAVPSIAIMNPSGEQASVFVVNSDSHATLRKIRPGIVVDAMTVVQEGLKEGEKVVTVGQLYLNNNDKVRTTEKSLEK